MQLTWRWRALLLGAACCLFAKIGTASGQAPPVISKPLLIARVAILEALPPLTDAADAKAAAAILKANHQAVSLLMPAQLADPSAFNAQAFDVLVLPHAETFPAAAQDNLLAFLRARGKLLCLGRGAPFSRYVYADGGVWKTRESLLLSLPTTPLMDFGATNLAAWTRATNDPNSPATLTREGSPHGPALHFRFAHFTGWDNFSPPPFPASPFAPGAQTVTFWAKGGPHTRALVMEWKERDGSRWIGAVKLTGAWQRYALTPADFHYWPDSPSQGRGGPSDSFHPENAREWHIGLAQSHALMAPGPHEFWLAAPGSARLPANMKEAAPPLLECLSPAYKGYFLSVKENPASAARKQRPGRPAGAVLRRLWVPIVRQRGIGLTGERPGRLMPVELRADTTGIHPGDRAWAYLCLSGPMQGALCGGVAQKSSLSPLLPAVRLLTQGVYLAHAGTEKAAYVEGESITIGFKAVNTGSQARSVEAAIAVRGDKGPIAAYRSHLALAPEALGAEPQWRRRLPPLLPGTYTVRITLLAAGALTGGSGTQKPVDRIEMPFRVLPRSIPTARFQDRIRARSGEFVLNGKPWRPVGVNYWPFWVIGEENQPYWVHWIAPDQYDPELVEPELTQCERLGVNLLSVQYTNPDEGPALDDFLARCRNHRLRVNVFVADANPLDFHLNGLRALLNAAHLRGNATVFAFDIACEPYVGAHTERKALDAAWRDWILAQYGSIAGAERDWGLAAPREEGQITNPSDAQLAQDGPWRVMVAAYRRFLDDRISRGYREVVQVLRPYGALIGARSGYGGNGSLAVAGQAPFDLLSGAAHLDFISPEGYALGGAWPEFRGGGLTTAYARWAGNGKPVFWAEFGQSVYPDTTPDKIAAQGAYYDKMYRLLLDSGANGSAAWWYPGGLRVDENSDFGIVSPDGSPRPAARRLQRHAAGELPRAMVNPPPTAWITVDRDADARGYAGIYARWRGEYARMRAAGLRPGVRTPGTGTTTATMPLVAVGNVPANGSNPLKYANAELSWQERPGKRHRLLLYNTGDAGWAQNGPGRVELLALAGSRILARQPLPRAVPRYRQISLDVSRLLTKAHAAAAAPPILLRLAVIGRRAGANGPEVYPFGEDCAGAW